MLSLRISWNISGDRLFYILNISYAGVSKLQWCIVTDLSFSKSSKKLDENSLYTKLSALLLQSVETVIMCSTEVYQK